MHGTLSVMQAARRLLHIITAKKYRRYAAVAIILLTVSLMARFFLEHPDYLARLRTVPPSVVILIVLLNIPAMAALIWANDAMLRLCNKPIGVKENGLLTAYSSIINFFGPLQSGPGVRLVYLKTRHKVRIRDYMLATLIYYALFASYSALFLLVGMRPWWQTVLAVTATASFSALVIYWFSHRRKSPEAEATLSLRAGPLAALAAAVLLQLTCFALYYFVELHAVNPSITISQAISYTGAANFSLFVSLTPDAIGFREAFLIFSQQVHHVSTADILNANIIDRGSYLIYLSLLLVLTLSVHARDRLHLRGWRRTAETR